MLAKTMELGLRITKDPALAVLDLHVWTANASEPTARAKHPRYALKFADLAARIVRSAIESDDAAEFLVTAPRFGFTEAVEAATGEAAELLERARNQRAVYNERLDAETFLTHPRLGPRRGQPAGRSRERGDDRDADLDARRGRPAGGPALARGRP